MSVTGTEQHHGALGALGGSAPQSHKAAEPQQSDAYDFATSEGRLSNSSDQQALNYQAPILEEDESNETASEPLEPATPTSDAHSHSFEHRDGAIDKPPTAPAQTQMARPLPSQRSKAGVASMEGTSPPKQGLGKRVGSFMKNKLSRRNTRDAEELQIDSGADHSSDSTNNGSSTTQAIPIPEPRVRRFSSFSISARNSPKSSQSNTPPTPSSPSSTITDEHRFENNGTGSFRHKFSRSATGLSKLAAPKQPGIQFAEGLAKSRKPSGRPTRRRSASTEIIPSQRPWDYPPSPQEPTVGLVDTFSTRAVSGAGMKARRLSLSLPDDYVVDYCELDKEFKSSSLMPGKRGKRLGKGATAEVRVMAYRSHVGASEKLVAVKEFRAREDTESEEDYSKKIKSEYSIAKSLHHPNIVDTVRLCTHNGRWNHVMEYCDYGEMYTLVERGLFKRSPDDPYNPFYKPEDRLCFFKQLLRGVDYLHSHGIAHRDIKLENLLLSKDGFLKLSDFGVSEVFSGEHPGLRAAGGQCGKNMGEVRLCSPGLCGSLPYMAPEVIEKRGEYDPRPLDIWSCAIVFLAMYYGGSPWEAAKTQHQHYARFKKGWDDWLATHPDGEIRDEPDGYPKCGPVISRMEVSQAFRRLLLKMLHPIPSKRISSHDIINSTVIKAIECCSPESYEDTNGCCVDVSQKGSSKSAAKMYKQKKHHHIPPKSDHSTRKLFRHRFDMGDGYS